MVKAKAKAKSKKQLAAPAPAADEQLYDLLDKIAKEINGGFHLLCLVVEQNLKPDVTENPEPPQYAKQAE